MPKTTKKNRMVYPKKKSNTTLVFLLVITCSTYTSALLIPVTGGSYDGVFIAPRNPFYPIYSATQDPIIHINYPVNEETYQKPTLDINVTVTGGQAPYTCEYKIDDNLWNDCGDCSNPLCGSARTFHAGENTLTVRATDANNRTDSDAVTFEVKINPNAGGDWDLLLFVPIALGLYLVMEESHKKER